VRPAFPALRRRAAPIAAVALVLAIAVPPAGAADVSESRGFRKAVTLAGIREHQAALQAIADANGGTRLSGTPGYDASVDYVQDRLEDAGYAVTIQPFNYQLVSDVTPPEFQQTSPTPTTYVNGVDYATMSYSGSGNVTAPLSLPSGDVRGCYASDWAGFPAGNVALVQRGTPTGFPGGACTFRIKAVNAVTAGASAVIVFNNAAGPLNGTLGEPRYDKSVIGVTQALGQSLAAQVAGGPVSVHVKTDTIAEERTTYNVIAETASGDPHSVLVVGAHLDSVSRGPGINDNGSGSGTILEIAEQFAAQGRIARNKIRFMWFGAEEAGLIGSTRYVASLSQAQRDDIMAMLNFDMVGSPNFVRFVYDGDGSATQPAGPPGSAWIEDLFVDYFESQGLDSSPTQFSGRSDYGPFIAAGVGIPAGGLFTGAEGIKTAEQAEIYGGTAGIAFDPCYHLACDTYNNNSNTALDQMSDAAAHAVLTMSRIKVDITVTTASVSRLSAAAGDGAMDQGPHPDHDHEAVDH
jgi:Zn-dependent M28 family amino/carboxypeptidase